MIFLFAILWYLFLGWVVYQFQKHTRCFTTWNTFTLFLSLAILSHGINVPFSMSVNKALGVAISDGALVQFAANLVLMYVSILLGVLLVNRAFRYTPTQKFTPDPKLGINPLVFWPVVILFNILLIYKLKTATINLDLFSFFSQSLSPEEYKAARVLFGKTTSSEGSLLLYFANIASLAFFPCLLFVFYLARDIKKNVIITGVFWATLVLLIYHSLVSGHKASVLFVIVGLLICHNFKKGNISFAKTLKLPLVLAGVTFFLLLPFLYAVQYSYLNYWEALYSVWYRLTIEPNRVLQLYYYTYPEHHDYLLGTSSQWVARVVGTSVMPPHSYIPKMVFGQWRTTWNAIFIGDAWADFAYAGTVLFSLTIGILLQLYNIWFSRSKKTVLVQATYVALIINALTLATAGMLASFLSFGLLSVFVLYLFSKELIWLKELRMS